MRNETAPLKGFEPVRLEVAGIVFGLAGGRGMDHFPLGAYRGFHCSGEPEVSIIARNDDPPEITLRDGDKIFDSEAVWSLFRTGGRNIFRFTSPVFGPQPYRLAIFDGDFRRGEVFSRSRTTGAKTNRHPDPLEYPLSEVLMTCLLAQGRGLMVHGCGVKDGSRGYLFAGNSTDGKTTMARLWNDQALVLNDDRIVLRLRRDRIWMYGTPWHGEFRGTSRSGVPLDKVFFLRHASIHSTRPVTGATASAMLLARCFLPLWDREGMNFTLDFCSGLVKTVSCFELGFIPEKKVLNLVRCAG
jgi:hypothetical protein